MRTLRLVVVALALAPAVGCNWMKEWREGAQGRVRGTEAIPPVPAADLVKYLNDRAAALRSIEYPNMVMVVSGQGIPIPATLEGDLACAQPRNFKLLGAGRIAASKVIMGSNADQFWLYLDAPGGPPMYVYAAHTDFESGRARLPGGIPFEPDWVMQTLGMVPLDPANEYEQTPFRGGPLPTRRPGSDVPPPAAQYSVPINEKERTYTLRWEAMTPARQKVFKEVVFDADSATESRPQVKRHVIRDAKNKVLASAEVKSVRTLRLGADPAATLAVQYPTHMVLRWEEQKFEMDLKLGNAQVNHLLADDPAARALFTRPTIRGPEPIDLAGGFAR